MATSLIQALSKLEGKTPDEIMKAISNRSWVLGKDFTPELHMEWSGQTTRICYQDGNGGWVMIDATYNFVWALDSLRLALPDYGFILSKDWKVNIWPT